MDRAFTAIVYPLANASPQYGSYRAECVQ